MGHLTHEQYDRLERAVTHARRIAVSRRGTELVFVPLAVRVLDGREAIEARNPATGDALTVYLDEVDSVETL